MKTISAEEFDRRFDDGEELNEYFDMSTLRRVYPKDMTREELARRFASGENLSMYIGPKAVTKSNPDCKIANEPKPKKVPKFSQLFLH